jgi:glycolate dehydrogenase FAD-binding subunit
MAQASLQRIAPQTAAEAAAALGEAAAGGRRVRFRGGGTKLGWGNPTPPPDVELSTERLDAIVEHNEGDLTAILQAGVPLARAQEAFRAAGQMLALDPPDGDGTATIGGIVATADSGPLRHRHNAVRDLVLGVQLALPDGSVARAGSKVIKNVAGYDLAKLLSGSFGTLGLIVEVNVRLHPLPLDTVSAVGRGGDPAVLAAAASDLAHRPIEAEALDVSWSGDAGAVLVRFGGVSAPERARTVLGLLSEAGLDAEAVDDDGPLWSRQAAAQRSAEGMVVRVSTTQHGVAAALSAARGAGGSAVGRAALGLVWITLPETSADAVRELREQLAPAPCVVLDAPDAVREAIDPWDMSDVGGIDLMRRVKERFDPHGVCNPGLFAGGI